MGFYVVERVFSGHVCLPFLMPLMAGHLCLSLGLGNFLV